jgi:ribosome-associated protein YbcJ (S4-like RNA binding protein)
MPSLISKRTPWFRHRDTENVEETTIAIRGEFITLGNLIKLGGLVGTGGEVKEFLANVTIRINGEIDDRRGRKVRPGDVVTMPDGSTIRIVAEA